MKKMNDQDYIRKAVELADGWNEGPQGLAGGPVMESRSGYKGSFREQELLDALAAQLVRQVEGREQQSLWVFTDHSVVDFWVGGAAENRGYAEGPDRTMNTIKAIVDSGVLKAIDND